MLLKICCCINVVIMTKLTCRTNVAGDVICFTTELRLSHNSYDGRSAAVPAPPSPVENWPPSPHDCNYNYPGSLLLRCPGEGRLMIIFSRDPVRHMFSPLESYVDVLLLSCVRVLLLLESRSQLSNPFYNGSGESQEMMYEHDYFTHHHREGIIKNCI